MKVSEYINKILENPDEETLFSAGKRLRKLSATTGGSIAYEIKIFSKEIGSLASFASPKATIMQWSEEKIQKFIKDKMRNLSTRALNLEIQID
jgi:hypothetical protein